MSGIAITSYLINGVIQDKAKKAEKCLLVEKIGLLALWLDLEIDLMQINHNPQPNLQLLLLITHDEVITLHLQ